MGITKTAWTSLESKELTFAVNSLMPVSVILDLIMLISGDVS
jgi:hypothetical protein